MIEIQNLSISYGSLQVINDLTLHIKNGTVHGLAGLNGSGKTTLLNALYGLKKPESGKLLFNNSPLKRSDIAYLETTNFFYSNITGREYLELFLIKNRSFGIDEWNALFDLPLDKYISDYSTGMKKKVALMGIIALSKPIIILDEPFNGLDMETTQKLKLVIKALKKNGKTIIITSHILESLTSICDSISYLEGGKIELLFEKDQFQEMEEVIFKTFNRDNEKLIDGLIESGQLNQKK